MKMEKITKTQATQLSSVLGKWAKENMEQASALRGIRSTKRGGKANEAHSKRLHSSRKRMITLDKQISKLGFKHYSDAFKYLKRHKMVRK